MEQRIFERTLAESQETIIKFEKIAVDIKDIKNKSWRQGCHN